MDDTVKLRTSDDPYVKLKASCAVLIGGSKVLADMLARPQGHSSSSSVDVAATERRA